MANFNIIIALEEKGSQKLVFKVFALAGFVDDILVNVKHQAL